MKIRTIVMSLAVVLAVCTAAIAKRTAPADVFSILVGGSCFNTGGYFDQPLCSPTNTGAQCTTDYGTTPVYQFEPTTTPSCSVPLRARF